MSGKVKMLIVLGIVMLLAIIGGCTAKNFFGKYKVAHDKIIALDEKVNLEEGDLEASLQDRWDTLPAAAKVLKAMFAHDVNLNVGVAEAEKGIGILRSELSAKGMTNFSQDPELMKRYVALSDQLGNALNKITVQIRQRPENTANKGAQDYMNLIAGQGTKLKYAREEYNEAVSKFNTEIRSYWGAKVAADMGLKLRQTFKAQAGAQAMPQIEVQ